MIRILSILGGLWLAVQPVAGQEPALTIYNQNFAVVREKVPLDLKAGTNTVHFTGITAQLEPESVILRDPSGQRTLQILEQNYQSNVLSEELLLSRNEGRTIHFVSQRGEKLEVVTGKIIRSPQSTPAFGTARYGTQVYPAPPARTAPSQAIVELDGHWRFGLPGTPLFPQPAEGAVLKPTLDWLLRTDKAGTLAAELAYVTGGMNWQADYNVVAPPEGDLLDVVGWVTMENRTGRTFEDAKIKLMAGDISKVQLGVTDRVSMGVVGGIAGGPFQPPVSEKPFEDYHLYALERATTLRDGETKQVEFLRTSGVKSRKVYVYDGMKLDPRYANYGPEYFRTNPDVGADFNPKARVMRELVNSKNNRLGIPLPKGRVRFYRRDEDGQLEFTGENILDHTPPDETSRVYTGSAFDVTGERRRTNFRVDMSRTWLDESFEIRLRNHQKEAVTVQVVEHLYRGMTWEITSKSADFRKVDSQQVEFRLAVPAHGEQVLTYSVHYTW